MLLFGLSVCLRELLGMRIRKRSQSVAPATTPPQPISYKYQTSPGDGVMRGSGGKSAVASPAAVCSNIQGNRRLDDGGSPLASPHSSSDVYAEPPVRHENLCRGLYEGISTATPDEWEGGLQFGLRDRVVHSAVW